jgi:hypothetical protein
MQSANKKLLTDNAVFILNMNAMFLIVIDIFMRFSRFGEEQVNNTPIGFFYYMTTLLLMIPLTGLFIWYEIEVRNKSFAD